jgi:acetylornithine/N-succinyldiaminopimelate aminotransferase
MKLFDVYPLYDIEPVKGIGCRVYDTEGVEYLDFYGGHAVISIGHAHPHYVKALSEQVAKLGFYSNSIQNSLQTELAQKLGEQSGLDNYELFLINSGAEANENALKLASFYNGRTKVIAFKKGFHGRTSAAVNVTPDPKLVAPINKGFEAEFHELNDIQSVSDSILRGDVAAVIIEGIQGIGGVHIPTASFLQELQAICNATDTVFILDEIQSGYGRSGKFFAFQHAEGITPDIVTTAKGMGNGFPIGGTLIHPKFKAKHGMLGTTFGGSHLACAAAIAVLDVLKQESLIENAATLGNYMMQELAKLPAVKEVRGLGLMVAVEFPFNVAALRKSLVFDEKCFIGSSSEANTVRILPPLSITKQDVDSLVSKMRSALIKVLEKEQAVA